MVQQDVTAKHLVSPNNKKTANLNLDDEVIKPEGALEDLLKGVPDNQEVEEATGNEGGTIDKWYNRAALILWPKQHRIDILGLDTMATQLSMSIEKHHPLQHHSAKWQKYYDVCKKLISTAVSKRPNAETAAALLTSGSALGEYSLVSDLIESTLTSPNPPTVQTSRQLSSAQFVDALLLACSTFGWHNLQPFLKRLMEADAEFDLENCMQFLYRLVFSQPSLDPELLTMGKELVLPVCKALVEEQTVDTNHPSIPWYWQSPRRSSRSQDFVCGLLKVLSLLDCAGQLEQALQSFSSRPIDYPVETVLLPAVEEFHQWLRKKSDEKWQKFHEVHKKLISAAILQRPNAQAAAALLTSAMRLGEYSLVSDLLVFPSSSTNPPTPLVSAYLNSAQFEDALVLACSTFSWASLQPCLKGLMEAGAACDVEGCVQFLYRLVTSQPSLNSELLIMGQELALPICKVLDEEQDLAISHPPTRWHRQSCKSSCRSREFVCSLLKALSLLDCATQMEQVLQSFTSRPINYPVETVLLPAAEEFHQWLGEKSDAKWQRYYEMRKKLISAATLQRPTAEAATALLATATALEEYSLVSDLLVSASSSTNPSTALASLYLKHTEFVDALLLACSTFSWATLQPCLKRLIEAGAVGEVESCVQFLYRLVTSQPSLNPECLIMGQELALPICKVLVEEQDLAVSRPSMQWHRLSHQPSCRSRDFVCSLLKVLSVLEYSSQMEQVLQSFFSRPNRYPLATVLLPAAEDFHQWFGRKSDVLLGFAAFCVSALEASTKTPIDESWSQDVAILCGCADCIELQSFCRHPTRTSARFRMNESRRKHLEQQIRASDCDCTHMTEYSGIPRTLVVTKTQKIFERKRQERKAKLLMLSGLRALHEANSTEPSSKKPCFIDLTDES